MPTALDIGIVVSGSDRAKAALDGVSESTKRLGETQAQFNRRQAEAAAVPSRTMQEGGLSLRREFVAGQAIQRSITSALGIDNGVTRTLDGFERIKYLADASGMSVGTMLATLGPMAAATASVAYAWKVGSEELDKTNKTLTEMGMKSIGFFEWAGLGLGVLKASEVLQVDPYKMAVKTIADMNKGLDETKRLEAAIAGNVNMTRTQRESALTAIRQDIALQQELLNISRQLAALQTRPINVVTSKIDADEKEIERINRVKGLQKELSDLQNAPRKVQANTIKEIDERMAELRAKTEITAPLGSKEAEAQGEASLRAQIELKQLADKRLDVQAQTIQDNQQAMVDMFQKMATGGARLPSADVFGSREYVSGRQQLEAAPEQQRIAEEQLQKASAQVLTLEAIRAKLESGQTVGVFTMDGVN
mgnify:CR=1 FL=1